jgi:hypothetical protein
LEGFQQGERAMADQATPDFKQAAEKPGYSLINRAEVVLATPNAEGTLMEIFAFTAAKPHVRSYQLNGNDVTFLGAKGMDELSKGEGVGKLAAAHTALLQLGGDPFGLKQLLSAKPEGLFAPGGKK